MANVITPKQKTVQEQKDTAQPWIKNKGGSVGVNEKFIKLYGNHPDAEVKQFYQKKGLIPY